VERVAAAVRAAGAGRGFMTTMSPWVQQLQRLPLRQPLLLLWCLGFGGSPSTTAGARSDAHSAVFVVTQAGLNNAPELYSQFLADAIADANAQMRQPKFWCGAADGQPECSGCLCDIKNQGVDVGVHLDLTTGKSPHGSPGDFFALAGDASSIKLEILPAGDGYIGAVKMTTMVAMGFNIPFAGSSLTGGGFFGICCSGFIWFHQCSCESGCGCHSFCSVQSRGIEATAVTELQVTVLVHHNPATGALSASMDRCPGGDCLDAPHLSEDLAIKCGCMGDILNRVKDSSMLQFLAWITGGHDISSMAKIMLDEAKAMVLPKINEKLREQLPMVAPQSCGVECGLPDGVEMSYKVPRAPTFVEAGYIEVEVDIDLCTTTLGAQRICFPPHDPFPPPGYAGRPYLRTGTMLAGMRVSSSLMNGVSWAMGNSNLFVTVQDVVLLDAELSFNISWAERSKPPVLKVPDDDLMEFEWSDGFVRVQCHSMPSTVDMLDFQWTELLGNGTFNHTLGGCNVFNKASCECSGVDPKGLECRLRDKCSNFGEISSCSGAAPPGRCVWSQGRCMANTCAFPQVSWFDTTRSELKLISPQLPVPGQLLTEAMQSALQSGKDELNDELAVNGMCLPPGIAKYLVPPPTVRMFKQHTAEHLDHGFLELVSVCGSGAGQQPCLTHRTIPASGQGGTDCLPGSSAPAVSTACIEGLTALSAHECSAGSGSPACQQLVGEVSTQCSPDEEQRTESRAFQDDATVAADTYIVNGVEYSVGVYTTMPGSSCVESCAGRENCTEQRFQNAKCSGFSVKGCVGNMYVERTYSSFNCTGRVQQSRNVSAGVCTTTTIPGINRKVSMQVVCPRVINRRITEPHDRTVVWVCVATAAVVLCFGACTVLYKSDRHQALLSSTSEACGASSRAIAGCLRVVYARAVRCWQPVQAAGVKCLGETGEARSAAALQIEACWTAVSSWISRRVRQLYADLVRLCTTLRGLSYNPRQYLGVHDWVHVALMLFAAVGYAVHLLLWRMDDPFAAFDRNVIGEVGLDDDWVDAQPVQSHFEQWSQWGQSCQAWSCVLIVVATVIGLVDQVTPKQRNTLWTASLAVVMTGQVAAMLVPSFLFEFSLELFYNANHSFTSDPETKSEADAALSLAFDGVALTFVSSLFVFMLHGLAPGVFLASCMFCSHLSSLQRYQKTTPLHADVRSLLLRSGLNEPLQPLNSHVPTPGSATRQSFSSFSSFGASGATLGSSRFTFAIGSTRFTNSWLTPRRASLHISDQVLTQQQPRVRIINWLSTLGAPCGGCLPVIIVYQSLGADTWWALMWPLCWVAPAGLMFFLSRALESRGRYGRASAMTNGATALCYIGIYGSITAAILLGLVEKARAGGFKEFNVQFPTSTFISTTLGTMAMTLSYLESAMLADATREHIGDHIGSVVLGSTRSSPRPVEGPEPSDLTEDASDGASPTTAAESGPWRSIRACFSPAWRWLWEVDEQMDPHRYGRRLPTRRVQLIVGLSLSTWVLAETYRESEGFKDHYVLKDVKQLLVTLDTGLQWPEGNATVLDEAFDVYGECCKAEFLLQCCAVALLVCACWCDATVREYHGLKASRVFGFIGLAVMFCSSLVPAGPNYLRISKMDTITPCCAAKFNFAITTLLQDLVGIVCSGLFAFRLLPVLLIVVPSMVRACTLLLMDDIVRCNQDVKAGSLDLIVANYADPAFSRSNVHSVLALCSMLTPIFTAIPLTVIFQFLRRYDQGPLLTVMISIFYAVPIALGMLRCDTIKRVELRYVAWMLGYLGPLLVMLLYEAQRFGFMDQVKERLLEPLTYAEIIAEMGLANVILSDIMYSNLYVERRQPAQDTDETPPETAAADSGGSGDDMRLQTLPEARSEPNADIVEAAAAAAAAGVSRPSSPGAATEPPAQDSNATETAVAQQVGAAGADESHVDDQKSQRSCVSKMVLLMLCPLLLLTFAVLSSMQALHYIDSLPWVSRVLGIAVQPQQPLGGDPTAAFAPLPVASNGHPCPWEA
jgi:hypothetical protein